MRRRNHPDQIAFDFTDTEEPPADPFTGLSTASLVDICLVAGERRDRRTPLWTYVASTPEDAETFFQNLDEPACREAAAEVLIAGEWTRDLVAHRLRIN